MLTYDVNQKGLNWNTMGDRERGGEHMAQIPQKIEKAHEQLLKVLDHSYSPYSNLQVGAALFLKGMESPVFGVNVENASFGGTICAERSALVSAISTYGKAAQLESILIISSKAGDPIPPCGLCLQMLSEFVDKDFPVYLGDLKNVSRHLTFQNLLPQAFQGEFLKD